MTRYLLDTNVVSELHRRRAAQAVVAWFDGLGDSEALLSVMTIGELRSGAERLRRRDPDQAGHIDAWVDELVSTYSDSILPIDLAITRRWGELTAKRPLPVVDGLLAATADVHGLVLATRNTKDLAGTGVRLVNPWGDEPTG